MLKVIVHADDFGETKEITRGIVIGMESGAVTSTSVMANMPGTEYALPIARSWAETKSFGVHLNFCEGRALSGTSSLTDPNGDLLTKRQLLLRALKGTLNIEDVCDEVRAQIDKIGSNGVSVSHVDAHKHLHQLPVVRRAVSIVLAEFGIERVRVTKESRLWRHGQGVSKGMSRIVRLLMAASAANHFMSTGLRYPTRFLDIMDVQVNAPNLGEFFKLEDDRSIVEIGCHPGTSLADEEKPGSCDRYSELQYLMSKQFRNVIQEQNLNLVTYWEV